MWSFRDWQALCGSLRLRRLCDECTVDTIRLEAGADVSIDPLLVFPDETRVDVSISFLSLMCQVKPTNDDALVLGDCVRAVAARGGRLVDVIAALREISTAEPSAESLARRIEMYSALGVGVSNGRNRAVSRP